MGTTAARQVTAIVQNTARVLAIESMAAAEAIDLQDAADRMAPRTASLYRMIREYAPTVLEDRSLSEEIEMLAEAFLELREPLLTEVGVR